MGWECTNCISFLAEGYFNLAIKTNGAITFRTSFYLFFYPFQFGSGTLVPQKIGLLPNLRCR